MNTDTTQFFGNIVLVTVNNDDGTVRHEIHDLEHELKLADSVLKDETYFGENENQPAWVAFTYVD